MRPIEQRAHANVATDVIRLADGSLLSSSYDGKLALQSNSPSFTPS